MGFFSSEPFKIAFPIVIAILLTPVIWLLTHEPPFVMTYLVAATVIAIAWIVYRVEKIMDR